MACLLGAVLWPLGAPLVPLECELRERETVAGTEPGRQVEGREGILEEEWDTREDPGSPV